MALRRRRLTSPSGSAMRKVRISVASSTYHLGAQVQFSRETGRHQPLKKFEGIVPFTFQQYQREILQRKECAGILRTDPTDALRLVAVCIIFFLAVTYHFCQIFGVDVLFQQYGFHRLAYIGAFQLGSTFMAKSNAIAEPMRAEEKPMRVCARRKRLLLISSLVALRTAMLVFRFSAMRCAWMESQPE